MLPVSSLTKRDVAVLAQVGRFNFNDPSDEYESLGVGQQYVHPNYTVGKKRFDVMLLKLNGTTSHHSTVMLNRIANTPTDAETVVAMGFGLTNANDYSSRSSILLQVQLNVVNNTVCDHAAVKGYGNLEGEIKPDMMCATAPGRDTCLGDSGGPLIIPKKSNNNINATDLQVGVTSW